MAAPDTHHVSLHHQSPLAAESYPPLPMALIPVLLGNTAD